MLVICMIVKLCHVHQIVTTLFKQLMMLLDLLETIETPSVFYCLMLQNIGWLQAQYYEGQSKNNEPKSLLAIFVAIKSKVIHQKKAQG